MSRLFPYSRHTAELLADPPAAGQGRHIWIFRVASGLLKSFKADFVQRFLCRLAEEYGWTDRDFESEIVEAVAKIESNLPIEPSIKWPDQDDDERRRRAQTTPLFQPTPTGLTAEDVLPRLYKPDELVCIAPDPFHAITQPLAAVLPVASAMAYIVANPMRASTGKTALGRESARSLDNACTLEDRRYLIVEFDQGEPLEDQAAVLSSLNMAFMPLVMAVYSGGKSIHGWFSARKLPAFLKQRFFELAVYIGADRSLWDRSKLVRMPGGRRENGKRQDILYFNPEVL
ncbi:MAG TPA: hypothetical protein P5567_11505 [Kiritimatiellia bacterium]|nr:hypothetical protein [Kiritimatiellia bacterium]HSA17487.1 hypothetical protein [Kiritimatiellia bacterium]